MTVYCDNCEMQYDVEPTVCKECGESTFLAVEDDVVEEIETAIEVEDSIMGFRGSPADIKYMFNLITLPKSSKEFTFPSFALTKKGTDFYINESVGNSIVGFLRFYEDGFLETWGEGEMPFNAEKSHNYIDLMRNHNDDGVSIHYDKEQGVISFFSGKKDIISNRSEIRESINTCPDITENHSDKPFPFDEEAFCPILRSGSFSDGYSFKVNPSELRELVKRAEKFNADYYPFKFNADKVEVGVNDMKNPVDEGAFIKQIDCQIITPPPEEVYVELGKAFVPVVNNVRDDIEIVFAGSNLPVWIRGVLTDDVGNITGRFGFVLPPRTA